MSNDNKLQDLRKRLAEAEQARKVVETKIAYMQAQPTYQPFAMLGYHAELFQALADIDLYERLLEKAQGVVRHE